MAELPMYPDFYLTAGAVGAAPLPYVPPSQLPLPSWLDRERWPEMARPELINGLYRCQRCGMCVHTPSCPVLEELGGVELATPRGRLTLMRGLLEERFGVEELPEVALLALKMCKLCGRCSEVCIANVAFREGKSSEVNIDHSALFKALRHYLERQGLL